MPILFRTIALGVSCVFVSFLLFGQTTRQLTDAERNYIVVETLDRISGNINSSPGLKDAVYNTLPKVRGTEAFVRIVKKFDLKDQDNGLVDTALRHAAEDFGVEAARLVFHHGNGRLFSSPLSRTNQARTAIELLGKLNEKRVVPVLLPVLTNESADVSLRRAVVHSLAQTQEGATELLRLAREDKLAADVKFAAGSELSSVRWPQLKTEAEKVLPPPQGKNTEVFPPVATLAQMTGSKGNGEAVFFRDAAMCSRCHEVRGKGGQIGPALSEIGTKLGREALIEAILDPSAGISFGFEAFNLTLKSGDEAYGLLASETEDDLAIKDLNGIVTHYKKSEITKRDQLKTSIMPTGLQQTMSPQEFVDLIDYLSSLKKVEQAKK